MEMKTKPNANADHNVKEVIVGSVVRRTADRAIVSWNVARVSLSSDALGRASSGINFTRSNGPRVSFIQNRTTGVNAPYIINSIQNILSAQL